MKAAKRTSRRNPLIVGVLCCSLTVIAWGNTAYIYAKATLAQYLIADAWKESLQQQTTVKPWPWADTWPVARLKSDKHDIDLYVLAGASGASLAFGPGHVDGTALPGAMGTSVIGGHRDTHFGFLNGINNGDEVHIQTQNSLWRKYKITEQWIADIRDGEMVVNPQENSVFLVTCYPFESIVPGGPLRYVVRAEYEAG